MFKKTKSGGTTALDPDQTDLRPGVTQAQTADPKEPSPDANGSAPLQNKGAKEPSSRRNLMKKQKEQDPSKNRKRINAAVSAQGKSQRRMVRIGLLVITGIIGIGGGVSVLHRSTTTTSVYIATKGIPAGAVLAASDFGVEQVPLPGVAGALSLAQIINSHAAVSILPGEVLTKGLTTMQSIDNTQAIIGVVLAAGHMPSIGVTTGTQVEVIFTGQQPLNAGGSAVQGETTQPISATPGTVIGDATVSSVTPGSNGSGTMVDLIVPTSEVPVDTTAAANNDISLARRS